ncbi:hypothetical protein A5622_17125 [Mycobacterium sp. 1245801.1]|nr:hypothetical protein A5622_17125 [Mycobacterium sp. 1245801.1]
MSTAEVIALVSAIAAPLLTFLGVVIGAWRGRDRGDGWHGFRGRSRQRRRRWGGYCGRRVADRHRDPVLHNLVQHRN